MAAFTPFERAPHLAVGVSGGADSLALALLADRWARGRGGRITALTVDHRLRLESGREAAEVGTWMAARGIRHDVLPWIGEKPDGPVQPAARQARRDLLAAYCRQAGLLHLLLAHHADDQAETVIMRAAADSGRDGLSGMAAVVETADVRILRPLLDISRARLEASLSAWGQPWIDDPSNRNPRFLRTVARNVAAAAADTIPAAADFGVQRARRDVAVAELLAAAVALHAEGWASADAGQLAAAPADVGQRALARTLMTVGSRPYPPSADALARLYDELARAKIEGGRTLGGCRIIPWRSRVMIVREVGAITDDVPLPPSGSVFWDGRFLLRLTGHREAGKLSIRSLGQAGWVAVAATDSRLRSLPIPPAVRPTLPAVFDLDGVRDVPHLMYRRQGVDPDSVRVISAMFRPRHVLAGAGFAVFSRPRCLGRADLNGDRSSMGTVAGHDREESRANPDSKGKALIP